MNDCWKPYFKVDAGNHQIRTAHLLRELKYLGQLYNDEWSANFTQLLKEALLLKKELIPVDYPYPIEKRKLPEVRLDKLLQEQSHRRIAVVEQVRRPPAFAERSFGGKHNACGADLRRMLIALIVAAAQLHVENARQGIAVFGGESARKEIGITQRLRTQRREDASACYILKMRWVQDFHALQSPSRPAAVRSQLWYRPPQHAVDNDAPDKADGLFER